MPVDVTTIERIEVEATGTLNIRFGLLTIDAGVTIARKFHRLSIKRGGDASAGIATANASIQARGFPALSAACQTHISGVAGTVAAQAAGIGATRDQVTLLAGAWTWFNDPRAIHIGGVSYAGAVATDGSVVVGPVGSALPLHSAFEVDDHDNPAFLRRSSDGRILACYSRHGVDDSYYIRLSTAPDDLASFQAERNLGSALGATQYTYANLVEITDGIFNFLRCVSGGGVFTPHYAVSPDGGTTWSAAQKLLSNPGQRPYFKLAKNGANRIDIICTDGHPGEVATNSVYHFYYSVGSWFKSDGTPLGALPFNPASSLTRIYDGSSVGSWVWDVKPDGTGKPVAVFAAFPTALTDHRYRYAKWNGSAWMNYEICIAGGTIYPVGNDAEPYYSGGICIDPDDINTIYCSRETGSIGGHRNGGTFQIWKGVTADGGQTWTMTQLTFGMEDCIRPVKLAGVNKVLFVRGVYSSYVNFSTQIASLAL